MLKYVDTQVTFAEVPDEITLCINISNCPCHCEGCHSSYLAKDIGTFLDCDELINLVHDNIGVTCIAFMGGDSSPESVNTLARHIRNSALWDDKCINLKVAWYSGRQELSEDIDINNFDYIKLGPYIEELGGLTNPKTNQRFYKVISKNCEADASTLKDITNVFWNESKITF